MDKKVIVLNDVDKAFKIDKESSNTIKHFFQKPWSIFQRQTETFTALSDISFSIEKGEFVSIIGRNGSGKSTLMKIIAGIYHPDRGSVRIKGRVVPFLELGVGFNPELTAKENIYLNGTILGMTRNYINKKYSEIVKFAELEGFMHMQIKNFSSGMAVRLAFSIAIQAKADIYLLDEVLAVGDFAFRKKSLAKMHELIRNGSTVIFVSHDLEQVAELSDRVIFLKDSKIFSQGQPDNVIEDFKLSYMSVAEKTKYLEIKKKLENSKIKANILNAEEGKLLEMVPLNIDIGDGRAHIKKVLLINSKGKPTKTFLSGEAIEVQIEVEFTETIKRPFFAVHFRKDIDRPDLAFISTKMKSSNVHKVMNGQVVICKFTTDELRLNHGQYHIWTHVVDLDNIGTPKTFASLVRSHFQITVKQADGDLDREDYYEIGLVRQEFTYTATTLP